MPEPVAIAALAVGALTWAGLAALGGHVGNVTDRLSCNLLRAYRHRVAGLRELPENHDLARAVRTAQMQALERSIRDFRELHNPLSATAAEGRPEAFVTKGIAFCARTVGRSRDLNVKLDLDVTEPLAAMIEHILAKPVSYGPASERMEAIASFAENAVLDELSEHLNAVSIPSAFEVHFRKGSGKEHPRFLDLFGAYITEQIKDHPRVHAILTTGQLARIEGLTFDATEMLYRIETHFTGVLGEFQALIDRLTADLSLSNAEKVALAAELAKVKADLNGTHALVGGFLETMVGRRVPPEQFATILFRIAADWKRTGEQINALVASRNLSPHIVDLKEKAAEAHKAGRLDEVATVLSEIDSIESEALALLETQQNETQEETRLRRKSIADTKAAQAGLARVRLAYREAADYYRRAAQVVSEADPREEWGYLLSQATALYLHGEEFGDNTALVEAIKVLRDDALPRAARDRIPLDWATTQDRLGAALGRLGERESGSARCREAVSAFRASLEERTRERVPLDWATTQTHLGVALSSLGERENEPMFLEEAVIAHRAALQERPRELVPLDWATTQNNLGNVLTRLGEQDTGTTRLDEAVAAYRAALEELTRELIPLSWATTQNNLGTALSSLGLREGGTTRIHEAVAAYRAALEERTRERVPLDWAATQYNLAGALSKLAEQEAGTTHLEEAVAAYRAALGEYTRERVPIYWARTQNNLGLALRSLGEREGRTAYLEEAVAAHRAALQEKPRELMPLDWATAQNALGIALSSLGERTTGTMHLEEAVAAHRSALEEQTRERVPLDWATTQYNLGLALGKLADRENGTTVHLEEAVVAYRAALEEQTRELLPLDWANMQNNLGAALTMLGVTEDGTARLEEAVVAYRAALGEQTRELMPLDWATTQNNLGNALRKLGERTAGTTYVEEAVAAYRSALEERTRERAPLGWAITQYTLGNALSALGKRENGTKCFLITHNPQPVSGADRA